MKKSARGLSGLPTVEQLFTRLRKRTHANADDLDSAVEARCVRDMTVLMCDSSGFTRRTHDYGILQFLAVMVKIYDLTEPPILKHRGQIIARGADNLLAVFENPADAVDSAVAMMNLIKKFNVGKHDRDQFQLCMGIHMGKILRLKDGIFGDKVNIAAKIGEDLASAEEILVTSEVAAKLPARIKRSYARSTELGGKTFELHRIKY